MHKNRRHRRRMWKTIRQSVWLYPDNVLRIDRRTLAVEVLL